MITDFSFGRIVVDGQTCTNDIKIVAGRLVPDWWRKSGHLVDIEDIQDILAGDSQILVIGKGQPGYMRVSDALRGYLKSNNIRLIEESTPAAIQTFNRLFKAGQKVSGGFHVTC